MKGQAREKIIVATKFAWQFGPKGEPVVLDSSPGNLRKTTDESLQRVGTDYIDLYIQHRLDPKTPIEDTMGALAELVKAGKVRYVGLSEVGPGTIRRAHAVHPLAAVQTEYSLWEREVEEEILPTLRELGIGFIAYSPMSRGLLTGKINDTDHLDQSDWRRTAPRFQPENLRHNLSLVRMVEDIGRANGATPAQVSLAWLLRRGNDIVPIPGTKRMAYLEENAKSVDLRLPDSAWAEIDKAIENFKVAGTRYSERSLKMIDKTR
jgi:aryl-alcohol dehydrogenase-like predicted oxidoreductase